MSKKAVLIAIGGSFHFPFMEEAIVELGIIIETTIFDKFINTCLLVLSGLVDISS